ncbi:MAG: hypothetical protein JNJ95_01985 [Dechloromonas sp.]|nr:hypothetical protein [Dechloromonas sp.]
MSGFLHQLANRSLGLAPQVRSRTALPYASPPADVSTTETASHELAPASTPIISSGFQTPNGAPRRAQRTDSAPPAPVVAGNIAGTERHDMPTLRPDRGAAIQPESMSSQQAAPIHQSEIARYQLPKREGSNPVANPRTSDQKPDTQRRVPTAKTSQLAESPDAALTDIESLVARLLGNKPEHPENPPEVATPPTLVAARQAIQRPAEISAIHPQSNRERPAITPQADEPPEVHITIGRLEVNPPNRPAPAAQPPRPRGPVPLSLSDYLARRNGGRT